MKTIALVSMAAMLAAGLGLLAGCKGEPLSGACPGEERRFRSGRRQGRDRPETLPGYGRSHQSKYLC